MTRWHILLFNCISLLITKVVTIEISCKKRKSQCSKFSAITTIRVRGFFKAPFFYIHFIWNYFEHLRREFNFKPFFQSKCQRTSKREKQKVALFSYLVWSSAAFARVIHRRGGIFIVALSVQRASSHFTFRTFSLHNLILLSVRWAMRTSRSQPQVRRRRGYEPNSRCGVCDKKNIKKISLFCQATITIWAPIVGVLFCQRGVWVCI